MPCSVLCASFQTRKGRCNILDLREFLPKIDSDFGGYSLVSEEDFGR